MIDSSLFTPPADIRTQESLMIFFNSKESRYKMNLFLFPCLHIYFLNWNPAKSIRNLFCVCPIRETSFIKILVFMLLIREKVCNPSRCTLCPWRSAFSILVDVIPKVLINFSFIGSYQFIQNNKQFNNPPL